MVRMKKYCPETRTTYYLKPGQTLQNTKVSERSLALIIPQSSFQRFADYIKDEEKIEQVIERKSKTKEDEAKQIKKRRMKEFLEKKKIEEAKRIQFMKEVAEKHAEERAEILKQAHELILYRKPVCRSINRALLTSECLRELNEQVKFQQSLDDIEKSLSDEQARKIMEDVAKFREEEKERLAAKLNKIKANKEDLENQMEKNKQDLKKMEESTRKDEIQDLLNMSKEIDEIKENELQEEMKKKEGLRKMFLENIEEKRSHDLKARREEEFQEKSCQVYRELKYEIDKTAKQKVKSVRAENARQLEIIANRIAKTLKKNEMKEMAEDKKREDASKQIEEQLKQDEMKKIEEKKRNRELARQEHLKKLEEEQERRKKEESEIKVWEMLQRYKRNEFNKKWDMQHKEEERKKRLEYGKLLRNQMMERAGNARREKFETDDSNEIKTMTDKVNQKVLAYGEQVLKESTGIRPIYPIKKEIEKFKRESGLVPRYNNRDPNGESTTVFKRRRQRRAICPKPIDETSVLYLG